MNFQIFDNEKKSQTKPENEILSPPNYTEAKAKLLLEKRTKSY